MRRRNRPFVTGLVLAAGGSRRLGRPKQLLDVGGKTLLDHTLDAARACRFEQLVVVLGANASTVRAQCDLSGACVVENPSFGTGCSSSIATGIAAVDPVCDFVVLLLGDQPGVSAHAVGALIAKGLDSPLVACRYDDGRGHPLAFRREMFSQLAQLHGDKAVWRLLEARAGEVAEVAVPGPAPRDVDTWQDYALLAADPVGPRAEGTS